MHEGADAADGHRDSVINEALQADATVQAVEEPSDSFDFGDDGHQSMGVMSVDAFLEEETSAQDAQDGKQGEDPQDLPVLIFRIRDARRRSPVGRGWGRQRDEGVAFSAADGSRTTAMPAVSDAGNLDLDALRMVAEGLDNGSEAVRISEDTAAVNPQVMYYNPPEDRSQELRDRARKERAVVTLTADEMEDMAVSVSEASLWLPLRRSSLSLLRACPTLWQRPRALAFFLRRRLRKPAASLSLLTLRRRLSRLLPRRQRPFLLSAVLNRRANLPPQRPSAAFLPFPPSTRLQAGS